MSNELGAGNSRAARLSVCTVMVLAVAEAIVVSATLFCCRSILGYAYSDVGEVVDYVKEMTPIICLSNHHGQLTSRSIWLFSCLPMLYYALYELMLIMQ